MTAVSVIGIGSQYGFDRLGFETLDLLLTHPDMATYLARGATLLRCEQPAAELPSCLRERDSVILVDAIESGAEAGVLVRAEGAAIQAMPLAVSTHGIGVTEVLALERTLGTLPQHVVLLGLCPGEDRDRNPGLGEVGQLCRAVIDELQMMD